MSDFVESTEDDIIADRLRTLQELFTTDNITSRNPADFVPGTFGFHEALHVTSMLMNNFDDYVLNHSSTVLDYELYSLAHKIHENMYRLYQLMGSKHLKNT